MNANQINWDAGQEQQHANPFVVVHRLLRGKYPLTIALVLGFGLVGAMLGYKSSEPQYRSTGVIRIQPTLPKVLYETEQNTVPKMFSSFVNSQAQFILSGGVIERAMESDAWRSLEDREGLRNVSDVQHHLDVEPDRRAQEIITVSFTDPDPRVSSTIVDAVLDAYMEKYSREGSIKNPEIVSALQNRQRTLVSERDQLNAQITEIARKYRTENLTPLIQNALLTTRQLEERQGMLLKYKGQYERFRTANGDAPPTTETVEAAANYDPMLADLLGRKRDYEGSRAQMMASEGLREEHRDVRRVTLMIDDLERQIKQRMAELRSGDSATVFVDEGGNPIPNEDAVDRDLQDLEERLASARNSSSELLADSLKLESLRADRSNKQSSLAEVENRLDMIQTESLVEDMKEISGKISIAARATRPSEPTSDSRFKMAAVGFMGLGSVPAALILALGYFNHRVQYSDDDILSGAGSGIIGMLPDMGNSLGDQELASASAFAVHQIRSQLQIKNTDSETRVYGVTSPAPGDGKTSMIIAIGLSFAESGNRTLLVDLDFIGRGLSVHFGYPHAPSLAESLTAPDEIDALIRGTEFDGLQILPAGFEDDERVSRLSPRTVGIMINHLRKRFDTILIDSGPILGSVEAAFISPQADGMIMVVGRGQYKPLIKKAVDQIHAVEGRIVATIFNRASVQDLRQSSSSMSVHFSRQFSRQQQEVGGEWGAGARVGPLGGALFAAKSGKTPAESAEG